MWECFVTVIGEQEKMLLGKQDAVVDGRLRPRCRHLTRSTKLRHMTSDWWRHLANSTKHGAATVCSRLFFTSGGADHRRWRWFSVPEIGIRKPVPFSGQVGWDDTLDRF